MTTESSTTTTLSRLNDELETRVAIMRETGDCEGDERDLVICALEDILALDARSHCSSVSEMAAWRRLQTEARWRLLGLTDATKVVLGEKRAMTGIGGGWSREATVGGETYRCLVSASHRVRIAFRGRQRGWRWLGRVFEAKTGRELWAGTVSGSIGVRGLLRAAGVIARPTSRSGGSTPMSPALGCPGAVPKVRS